MTTMREDSKQAWTSKHTVEEIKVGSLQRIADACEVMSKRYADLIDERDRYERWYRQERERRERVERSNAALRGHLGRLKRQADGGA